VNYCIDPSIEEPIMHHKNKNMRKSAMVMLFLIATLTCFGASPPTHSESIFNDQFDFCQDVPEQTMQNAALQATNDILISKGYDTCYEVTLINHDVSYYNPNTDVPMFAEKTEKYTITSVTKQNLRKGVDRCWCSNARNI